jgi:hypothetical protein
LDAADTGFYSDKDETAANAKGVKRVCILNRATKSATASASRTSVGAATGSDGAWDAKDASA